MRRSPRAWRRRGCSFSCFSGVAIGTSRVTNTKMLGLGIALAVLMDAMIVRSLLVPAVMRLTGRATWWAPGPLRRFHERFGLSEGERPVAAAEKEKSKPEGGDPEGGPEGGPEGDKREPEEAEPDEREPDEGKADEPARDKAKTRG